MIIRIVPIDGSIHRRDPNEIDKNLLVCPNCG